MTAHRPVRTAVGTTVPKRPVSKTAPIRSTNAAEHAQQARRAARDSFETSAARPAASATPKLDAFEQRAGKLIRAKAKEVQAKAKDVQTRVKRFIDRLTGKPTKAPAASTQPSTPQVPHRPARGSVRPKGGANRKYEKLSTPKTTVAHHRSKPAHVGRPKAAQRTDGPTPNVATPAPVPAVPGTTTAAGSTSPPVIPTATSNPVAPASVPVAAPPITVVPDAPVASPSPASTASPTLTASERDQLSVDQKIVLARTGKLVTGDQASRLVDLLIDPKVDLASVTQNLTNERLASLTAPPPQADRPVASDAQAVMADAAVEQVPVEIVETGEPTDDVGAASDAGAFDAAAMQETGEPAQRPVA